MRQEVSHFGVLSVRQFHFETFRLRENEVSSPTYHHYFVCSLLFLKLKIRYLLTTIWWDLTRWLSTTIVHSNLFLQDVIVLFVALKLFQPLINLIIIQNLK